MNWNVLRSQPWGLWRRQVAAIVRLEFKKNFWCRRAIWLYLLAVLPVLLCGIHSLLPMHTGKWRHGVGEDTMVFAGIFQFAYLRMAIFFGSVVIFANLFRGEMLGRTMHYYFLAPVRRSVLVVGKYLAALAASLIFFAGSVALAYPLLFAHLGPSFAEFFSTGGGERQYMAYLLVAGLACAGYGAVFLVMGMLFRNPMIPASLVMVWESINGFLPSLLKKFSIIFYLKSMCPVALPAKGVLALIAIDAEPASPWVATPGLLLLAAALLAYAAVRVRRLEISYTD